MKEVLACFHNRNHCLPKDVHIRTSPAAWVYSTSARREPAGSDISPHTQLEVRGKLVRVLRLRCDWLCGGRVPGPHGAAGCPSPGHLCFPEAPRWFDAPRVWEPLILSEKGSYVSLSLGPKRSSEALRWVILVGGCGQTQGSRCAVGAATPSVVAGCPFRPTLSRVDVEVCFTNFSVTCS